MKLRNSIILIVLSSVLLTGQTIRLSGANHGEYWLWIDEKSDTNFREHLEDKFKLALQYGDLTVRGVLFLWNPSLPIMDSLMYLDYTAEYKKDPVSILYGRYYTTFGRGLVLNAFLDEDFRIDNSLFGVKTDINYFNSELTLLMGKPRNIFFEENTYKIKNSRDTTQIRGADFETKLIPMTTLGARYVRINRTNSADTLIHAFPEAFTELYGGNIGFSIGPFDSYFEYARQWGHLPLPYLPYTQRLKGEGILFSASLALTGLGISFQYMDYDSIGFGGAGYRYNQPPTPIQSGISVNNGYDERGFGVLVSATPIDLLNAELSYNSIKTHDNDAGVAEMIGKLTAHVTYDLEVILGAERVIKDEIEVGIERKTETKPYVEFTYNLGPFFFEAGYEHNFVSSDTSDYYEHAGSFSIGKPALFVLTLRYERRNRTPEWLIAKLGEETNWPLAELSLDLSHRHNLLVRVGAEKGGLVCSGGTCRFEAPFKGVKVVLTSIF
jgi:hypothetical protein